MNYADVCKLPSILFVYTYMVNSPTYIGGIKYIRMFNFAFA